MNKSLFILILILFINTIVKANDSDLKYDSSEIVTKEIPKQIIGDFKEKRDFRYDRSEPIANSWFTIFMYKIRRFLSDRIGTIKFPKAIVYFLFVILLIFLILKISRTKFNSIFSRNSNIKQVNFIELEETLPDDNIDELINKEASRQNYRSAIRLLFLKLLKELNNRGFIKWTNEKTNKDYYEELQNQLLHRSFYQLSIVYSYVWYGEFVIDKQKFDLICNQFNSFFSSIDAK